MGKTVTLPRITGDAGTDDVLPGRLTPPVAGKNVIEIEITAVQGLATILAGVFIAFEDVVARELNFFFGEAFEKKQNNDPRDPDVNRDRLDHFRLRADPGEVLPTIEIMSEEIALFVGGNHLGVSLIEKGEGPAYRTRVHRLP